MNKKQILVTLLVTAGAIFLWKNYAPAPIAKVTTIQAAAPARQSTKIDTAPTRAATAPAPQAAAPARQPSTIVIAPTVSGRLVDRFKTGPNAQNNWAPSSGQLKTGPNAQNNWAPNSGQLKTGPNAQTDLTMKRSW
jgi:hypothetical protein